ncbi:MAG: hypothetical protein WCF36_16665 [Candidatus Nanopelagicales bacterium]
MAFPDAAELASPDGLMAGMPAAASMFGIVTLSFWAIAVATDYSSGLIRLLVAAMPRRWPLLVGKVAALSVLTVLATSMAAIVTLGVAPAAAEAAGIDTSLWAERAAETVLSTWASSVAAQLVWGGVGLAIAYLARSSAIAISVGVGYVLVVEAVIGQLFDGTTPWLLGNALTALAQGGNAAVAFGTALAWAGLYVVIGLAVATLVLQRRDVTD